ncbi:hypothetical protein TcG_04854 [Trypanosoma cruzi]|nr:hypothetical protein TcG_04854 [Trypanosoma cruzi]
MNRQSTEPNGNSTNKLKSIVIIQQIIFFRFFFLFFSVPHTHLPLPPFAPERICASPTSSRHVPVRLLIVPSIGFKVPSPAKAVARVVGGLKRRMKPLVPHEAMPKFMPTKPMGNKHGL